MLGPLLFIVYINDLSMPEVVQSNIAILPMTTSYIRICINTPDNSSTLQSDLDLLVE